MASIICPLRFLELNGITRRNEHYVTGPIIRLAPGSYGGEGNMMLHLDAQLLELVAGDDDGYDGRAGLILLTTSHDAVYIKE